MGLFERFPYTNFHDLNLTWILNELKTLEHTINEFVSINALKYADPIQWNITTQYEKNTIVIDPLTGTAYISVQPVPSGVALTNTDYWTVVFDLGSFVVKAAKNFCSRYEEATTLTATFPSSVNDWLIWGDTLYYALVNITAGDSYVVDSNIKQFTIEDVIGHIQDLNTSDKTNLVAAINELVQSLIDEASRVDDITGDLDNLNTTDKSNLVAAINEVLQTLSDTIGDLNDLDTPDKSSIVDAINSEILKLNKRRIIHVRDFGAVGDGVTDDTDAIQAAFNYNADNLLKTVIIDPGRYHTTRPLIMPPNLYVCCESYCEGCFLDTFPLGTIQLNSGCWIENVLFLDDEHPGVETYALYGTNIQGVSITHVQMSGATIGSLGTPTSGFLSLVGEWSIIMIKDCLVDAGGPEQFAFHLEGAADWTGADHPFGDRDIFIRDCFLDNYQPDPLTNLGGVFYIDSIKDIRMQGCIIRGSTNTIVLANTKNTIPATPQTCNLYASNCLIERNSTTGYAISIADGCSFENLGSVIGKTSYILNNGSMIQYDVSKNIYNTIPTPNMFTLDAGVTVTRQGNGTFFLEHTATATEDSVGANFSVSTDKFVRTMLSYYGDLNNESRYGIMFNDGTDDIYFYVNPFNNNLVVNKWNNQVYLSDIISPQLVNIPSIIGLAVYVATNRVIFYLSYDNVYWRELGEYFCTPPANLKIFANDGVVGNKYELQLLSLDVSD